jgi:hypothetical protein
MSARWDPSWRRLLAGTGLLFALLVGLLAIRVHAGADPGLRRDATSAPAPQERALPQLPRHERRRLYPGAPAPPYGMPGQGGGALPPRVEPSPRLPDMRSS